MKFISILFGLVVWTDSVYTSPIALNRELKKAFVNCNHDFLVQKLKEASIPFACLPNTGASVEKFQADEGLKESLNTTPDPSEHHGDRHMTIIIDETFKDGPYGPEGIIINEEIDMEPSNEEDCLGSASCDSDVQLAAAQNKFESTFVEASSKCPEGYLYAPDLKECLIEQVLPHKPGREEYFNLNSESLKQRKCKAGYMFDLEQARCIRNKKLFSVNLEQTFDFNSGFIFRNHHNCEKGSIFVPEVGICLPIEIDPITKPQTSEHVAFPISHHKKCPKGTVYSPEVAHCLVIHEAPKLPQEKPQSFSLVNDNKPLSDEPKKELIGKHKCKHGMVYVAEVDHCVSIIHEKLQADQPHIVTTTADPFRPSLSPLTAEQIGSSKCPKGSVYVSEIDLCLEPLFEK